MLLDTHALTITGRRSHNEDSVCARADLGLFVVADGMGGYEGGEVASRVAVETIEDVVASARGHVETGYEVAAATQIANARICERRQGALAQMGSTVAMLRLDGRNAVIGHVGDSRVYRLRDAALEQMTIDHSLWAQLVAAGAEVPEREDFAYKHVVTRALGTPSGEPDVRVEAARTGDVFLLCSDGLSEVLAPARIAELLALPAKAACHALVDEAYAAGSRDNISAIVVRVLQSS
jgi:serine/threonine protein phosphatase PrpC